MKQITKFLQDEQGAMSLEYALIAVLVSLGGIKSVHCITIYCIAPVFEKLANYMG